MNLCEMNRAAGCRILVIDDDIDLLMLLERRLQKEGYDVETAASLHEAEEIVPHFEPQLVLLDINVQGQDGRSFCWKLKKEPNSDQLKVILMSGYDPDKGRAHLFGADDAIEKPLHTDYLIHLLYSHLSVTG
jgi:DNA-binding response OmpR family regulator